MLPMMGKAFTVRQLAVKHSAKAEARNQHIIFYCFFVEGFILCCNTRNLIHSSQGLVPKIF
jgi:hypothetical protein